MNTEFFNILKSRRSCRKFASQQIADDALHQIIEAGLYAPSGHGLQDPVIVAVQRQDIKAKLTAMNAAVMGVTSDPFYGAPTYILVFASADNGNAFQDGSCVLENMMLAAHAVGLGSCWINREHEMFATSEGKTLMKELGLRDGLVGIGALAVGVPAAPAKAAAPRKEGRVLIVK